MGDLPDLNQAQDLRDSLPTQGGLRREAEFPARWAGFSSPLLGEAPASAPQALGQAESLRSLPGQTRGRTGATEDAPREEGPCSRPRPELRQLAVWQPGPWSPFWGQI